MNYEERLLKELPHITPADADAMARAAVYQGTLAKPPGSLGALENIYIRLCGISGKLRPVYSPCRIIVLCADNGVVEEGVSVTPRSVTAAQAVNMTNYCTGMSAMAHHFGDEIQVVDVGIADEYDCPAILNRRILPGTRNLAREPAMTRQEAARSVWTGLELARQAKDEGVAILGAGEMGIGNTTTSAAVLAALTGLPVEAVTGRGGGMTDAGFLRKKQVITDALALHRPGKNDVLDVVSKVGGVAVDYFFASHASHEVGYAAAIKELGLEPWLHLGMRLGVGSGCPIAFRVMEAACAAAEGMATFAGAAIDDSYLDDIRGKDCF